MYVANLTKQVRTFSFRLPEQTGVRALQIPIGGQIKITGPNRSELTGPEIESIITQHRKYGMVAVGEIDRTRPFVGTCYSTDRPIKVDVFMRAVDHNNDVLTERGIEIRKHTAVSINNRIEDDLAQKPDGLEAVLRNFNMTVQEEDAPEGRKQLSEGVTVRRDANSEPPPSQRSPRRKRARSAA